MLWFQGIINAIDITEEQHNDGICIWKLPESGPRACGLAAGAGLEGIELEPGSWEDGLPLTDPARRDAFLEAGDKTGIRFPTLGAC